ncbi:MAG: MIP/aquaporin family protein [Gemmatimonadales bacterium]
MKKLLTEFIGTFFLVFTIGLTVTAGSSFAPVAIGAALVAMVYMGGHISGAHYNPAVSLAMVLRGKLPNADFVPYVVAQLLGATAAAAAVHLIVGKTFAPAMGDGVSVMSALLIEVLFTFALALVVLNVATHKATSGNSYYGVAIGLTVTAGAFAGGPISGGAFNPAVGIGPTLINATLGSGSFDQLWLYIVGPLLGGVLAAVVFGVQEKD